MTVHVTFYSDMLELQQRGTELLLVIKFRLRKRKYEPSHFYFVNNLCHCMETWRIALQVLNDWCLQCVWQSLLHT